jgi:parvulin-like peptidyl-prolyl isomerase
MQVKSKGIWALLLISSFVFRPSSFVYAEDKIIAIVNNEVITQKDLTDFLNFMRIQLSAEYKGRDLENKIQSIKQDLLGKLIEDRLILRQAKDSNIKPDPARVKARLAEIKKRYSSDLQFQQILMSQGLTQADVEKKISEQLMTLSIIDQQIRNKIVVNPSEVTDFYQKHPQELAVPEERVLEAIAVDKEEVARAIYKELKSGADVKTTADKYGLPVDSFTAARNGSLNPDVEETVFKMALGDVSGPIKIQEVFYILKLEKINLPRNPALPEVQDKIYGFLYEKKMQEAFKKWLDELKAQSYIKIIAD